MCPVNSAARLIARTFCLTTTVSVFNPNAECGFCCLKRLHVSINDNMSRVTFFLMRDVNSR